MAAHVQLKPFLPHDQIRPSVIAWMAVNNSPRSGTQGYNISIFSIPIPAGKSSQWTEYRTKGRSLRVRRRKSVPLGIGCGLQSGEEKDGSKAYVNNAIKLTSSIQSRFSLLPLYLLTDRRT